MLNIRNILSVFLLTFFLQTAVVQAQYVDVCAANDYNCANQSALPTSYLRQPNSQKYPELCSVFNRTFGIGEQGQDVKRLQVVLGQEGIGYLGATGYFGPATRNAVKVFQLRNGIRQTGAVGPITLARMKFLWCDGDRYLGNSGNVNNYYNTGNNGPLEVSIAPMSSSGTNIMIGWNSKNTYVCSLNGVNVQTNGQQIFNVTAEATFTINCTGYNSGRVTKTIVVKPNQTISNLPTVNLSINPTSALINTYATLYWSSTNATSCTLNNQYVQVSGSQQILVTGSQVAYQLSCVSPSGLSVSSTVYANPGSSTNTNVATANITASANNISSGSAVTLNWSSTNTSSCTVTGGTTSYSGTNGTQVVYPTQTTTYTVTCVPNTSGPGVTNQVTVYINATNSNITLLSNSNRVVVIKTGIDYGGISCAQVINGTINWGDGQTQEITYCNGNQYTHTYSTNGTYNISITSNSTGQSQGALQVVVVSATSGNVTVNLSSNSTTVSSGQAVVLTWSSTNATYCNILNSSGTTVASNQLTSGSYTVYPITSGNYQVNCYNSAGQSNSAYVYITVNGNTTVTATITANPINPAQGQPSTLSWSSTNANYCNISGGSTNLINQPTSGSYIVYVSMGTNYQITCYNNNGQNAANYVYVSTSGSSTVTPTVTLNASSQNIYAGQQVTLNWYSTNANTCSLYGNSNLIVSNQNTSNTYLVQPTQTTNYQITCTNNTSGQSANAYVTVTVNGSSTNTQISLVSKVNGYVVVSVSNACNINGRIDWGDGYSSYLSTNQCASGNSFSHQYSSTNYNQTYLIRAIDTNNNVLNTLATTAY